MTFKLSYKSVPYIACQNCKQYLISVISLSCCGHNMELKQCTFIIVRLNYVFLLLLEEKIIFKKVFCGRYAVGQ